MKYMFVAMTQQEYNAQSIDDGTLPAVQHTHHNTGFTSWHCSFHDAVTYMLWCIATGVVAYTPVFCMVMFVPNVRKVLTNLYHGWGKAFNRSFLGLMYQGEPAYMFDTTEHGSADSAQDPRQLDANSQALQLYQWAHLDSARASECAYSDQQAKSLTLQHAGLSMSLYHSGTAVARHMGDDLQRALLTLHSSIHCTGERALQ